MTSKDDIYAQPIQKITDFQFDEDVVGVFADMINRSVPGYATIIAMSGVLAGRYAQPNSRVYDLGCSLGGTTLSMREHVQADGCHIVAIDNSAEMIDRFEGVLESLQPNKRSKVGIRDSSLTGSEKIRVELLHADVLDVPINHASVVSLNFTLQFIAKEQRIELLKNIYNGLAPGGILILSEKLHFEDEHLNTLLIDMHHEFKKANGYSELEISQKRTALENVLMPETLLVHQQRLDAVGFKSTEVWFQCFNFASMVAIK